MSAVDDGRGNFAAIVRGSAVVLLASLLGGGLGFVFSVVMARVLGADEFGLFLLAMSFVTSGTAVGAAGADSATVRYVAAAATPGAKRGAMVTPLLFVLVVDAVLAALLFALAPVLAEDLLHEPRATGPIRAVALVIPLTVAALVFSAGLSGLERTRGELARKLVEQLGRLSLAPLAVALGLGVTGAVLGLAGAAAAAAAVTGFVLLRTLPRGGSTDRISLRRVLSFAAPQTVAQIATQVTLVVNIAVLARYETARTVAFFGAALAISRLPSLLYNAFSFRFAPAISRLWEQGDTDTLRHLLKRVTHAVALAAVPAYAVALVLPEGLLRVYGHDFGAGATALVILTSAALVNALAGPVEWTLIMTGHVRFEMTSNLIAAACAITAALVLTPPYGLTGAALAQLVWAVALNALKTVFARRRLGLVALSPALLRPLGAAAVASGAIYAVARAAGLEGSLAGALLLGIALVAAYGVLLLVGGGLGREDRRALLDAVKPAR